MVLFAHGHKHKEDTPHICPSMEKNSKGEIKFHYFWKEITKGVRTPTLKLDYCPYFDLISIHESVMRDGRMHAIDSKSVDISKHSADWVKMMLVVSGFAQREMQAEAIGFALSKAF